MKRSCGHECEWKDLAADIVGNIAELLSPVDYIHLGRVCRTWTRALSGGLCLPKSPQTPWLILENNHKENEEDLTSIRFLDVFAGTARVYKMKNAKYVAGNHRVYAAGDGWLVTISPNINDTTMVWNPFTNAEVNHFPSILTLPADCRRGPNKRRGAAINADLYKENGFFIHKQFVSKIKVFKSPDANIMVAIAIYHGGRNIAYARPGDGSWTPLAYYDSLFVCDVVLYHECIYAVDSLRKVKSWNLITGSYLGKVKIKTPFELLNRSIYSSEYGKYFATYDDRLVMVWSTDMDGDKIGSVSGDIHKAVFELDNSSMTWNFVTRLGGGALFVDLNGSNHSNAMILNHPGLQGQVILALMSPFYTFNYKRVRSYDLVLQTYQPDSDALPCPLSKHRKTLGWFMPALSHS